jgi:protein gp37
MSQQTSIEWTATYHADGSVTAGASWNYITGGHCEASPGCDHCYARTFAERFRGVAGHPDAQGFDLRLWPERLDWPITRWKTGRRIFVNSMGDWLWKDVSDEFTLRAFETMLAATQHTYQLLTKRPSRLTNTALTNTALMNKILDLIEERTGQRRWPEYIHLGTTVESQAYAWRIDKLRQAVLRAGLSLSDVTLFVSAEPLLGEMTLDLTGIAWLIAGAESGRGARPMEEDWVRRLRDQCLRAETAFFYKQNAVHGRKRATPLLDGVRWTQFPDERKETRA